MSLSLKAELDIWAAALKAYDEQDFVQALDLFARIANSSKILTNMGLIYATIGEHETAIDHFTAATDLDAYLAIAHFQCGVSNFLLQRYDLALLNFEDAYLYLRGNEAINYDQLGLKFKLFSAEVMFNKGLVQMNMGYSEQGMADMQEASRLKVTDEHKVIDEAIQEHGEGYTVFSIPVGVLYRPSENKLKNSKSKDYLGKAKLVAASDSKDAFTEFTGVVKRQQAAAENAENKDEDKNKPDVDPSEVKRSATISPPRTDLIAPRPTAVDHSQTTLQLHAGIRPDAATILASRRSQSVSNPTNVSPHYALSLSRSNTTRLPRTGMTNGGVPPLRPKAPQQNAAGVAGVGANGSRMGAEIRPVSPMLRNQSSHRRLRSQGATSVVQEPVQPMPSQSGQYVTASPKDLTPLALPAVQGEGHLTQFYNMYMDVYADGQPSRLAFPSPPTTCGPSTSSQKPSPASSASYQQPQPQSQDRQQLPAWIQSTPSPVKSSSSTSGSPGMSCASSRAANASMNPGMNMESVVGMNPNMNVAKSGIDSTSGGSFRRKAARRPVARRATVYEDEDGDDGFITGEYEEFDFANIRVKLHYQGDVRGMTMPPTTTFKEFVERVTAKFGTPMMGLGMKFTDEDGTKISLRDEGDFELAIETARENAKGRSEGKIEIWCVDV